MFFYGSARYFRQTKWDRLNKVGSALPDEERAGHELNGKLTASPTSKHLLTASYRYRPNRVENSGLTSDSAPSVAINSDNGSRIGTLEWSHFMKRRRSLNLRYLYMKENNEDVTGHDLGLLPPFNPRNLAAMGQYTDPARPISSSAAASQNTQNYRRHEVRGVFSQFFERRHESRAEGRRRLRTGRGSVEPPRRTAGARSPPSRRTACRRCGRAITSRNRRRSDRAARARCSFRTM